MFAFNNPKYVSRLTGSLRFRLLIITFFWVLIALLATGFMINRLFENHVHQQYERQLQVYVDYLIAATVIENDQPQVNEQFQNPKFNVPLSGLYWQINNDEGQVVLRSRSLWDEQLATPNDSLSLGASHFHQLQGPSKQKILLLEQNIRFDSSPNLMWRIMVAEDATDFMKSIEQWQKLLFIILLVLFVTLVVATIAQVISGLSPVRRLQRNVKQLQDGVVNRLTGRYPNEFEPLVHDFNHVLDANDKVINRARAQAGDLAHAIQTPIAVMVNELDHAQKQLNQSSSGSYDTQQQQLIQTVRDQLDTLQSQVKWRLSRARVAAHAQSHHLLTSLKPIIESTLRVMHKVHAERNLTFEFKVSPESFFFKGEAQDLQEMVGNLVDNAGKWAKQNVLITLYVENNSIHIVVEDDGQGIEPGLRVEVMRRGVRMDEHIPGSGLGLAIVKELCELYDGQLTLEQSPLGGLKAHLSLPGRADR
jgi:signal transduction histidine kinase